MYNKFMLIASVLSATLAIAAPAVTTASNASPKAKTGKPAAKAGVLFEKPPAAIKSSDELLAHFQEIDKRLNGLSARYIQSVKLAEAGISRTAEGTVDYRRPSLLRLEYLKPEKQTIIVDDKKAVWVYRKDLNQVIQSRLDDLVKSDPAMDNLMALDGYSKLLANYDVSFDPKTQTAVLRPKAKNSGITFLRMKLAGPERFPVETDLVAPNLEVKTILKNLRFNPALDPKRFRFSPPKGAEVYQDFKMPALSGLKK